MADPLPPTGTTATGAVELPALIQGGMGIGVSDWRLAREVGRLGHLGVVSGTALDAVHVRRLGDGDPGGHLRRAYARFPVPGVVERVLERWFVPGGREPTEAYRDVPLGTLDPPAELRELTILANFAEVWLAKEGHDGPIGVNYLEKVQLPTPFAVYGAMLAGVDAVLVGAGIPTQLPRLLDDVAAGAPVSYRVTVAGAGPDTEHTTRLDPAELFGRAAPRLPRPRFLAIVSSVMLATYLTKSEATTPDGFVVEAHDAGGHNAPPRGRLRLDDDGEPIYGPRDDADPAAMTALGLPFWLAGGWARAGAVHEARALGAHGIQVGTAFALCEESALRDDLKAAVVDAALGDELRVRTDPLASPSGFPFKVVDLPGTLADDGVRSERRRVCDLGYLRTPYVRTDGDVGYRCPAGPAAGYVAKGGDADDTTGRVCLCNGLLATIGLGQVRCRGTEPAIVTTGDDAVAVVRALAPLAGPSGRWSAADVVAHLHDRAPAQVG
ncbi:MAG: nitronate monooxygenase [Actinomycetota bacterium]|nr:nitronate monooxygenase [Actinomycetota bacterium]